MTKSSEPNISNQTQLDELKKWTDKLFDYLLSDATLGNKRLAKAQFLANFTKLISIQEAKAREKMFQAIIPDEGVLEDTKGTFADGYTKAVEDICNSYHALNSNLSKKGNDDDLKGCKRIGYNYEAIQKAIEEISNG